MNRFANDAVAVGLLLVVLTVVCVCPIMLWLAGRRVSWGICERLFKGKKRVRVRTSWAGGAWNPALSPKERTRPVRGRASYQLNSDGLVVLDLVTADGEREQFIGPAVARPAGRGQGTASGIIGLVINGAVLTAGSLIGFLSSPSARALGAAIGAVIGLALAPLTGQLLLWYLRRNGRRVK